MNFSEITNLVFDCTKKYNGINSFQIASEKIRDIIFSFSIERMISLTNKIGIIPEEIVCDSKEEKLFSKLTEIFLSRCFIELGFKSTLFTTRSDEADVLVQSKYHNYSFISDAKSFRLSRTAKNQKDFKVESIDTWRKDNDYSVLCCPYFQYPKNRSQIYKQALERNVCLFSWEHIKFLLENNVKETLDFNLSKLWNFSKYQSNKTNLAEADYCFLEEQNDFIIKFLGIKKEKLINVFNESKKDIQAIGQKGIDYWQLKIKEIKEFSREEAIYSLLRSLKLENKVSIITKYINSLR